jgi:hypothetical protein
MKKIGFEPMMFLRTMNLQSTALTTQPLLQLQRNYFIFKMDQMCQNHKILRIFF